MPIELGENRYGESGVRLLRVVRQEGRHDVKEMTLDIRFEGNFEEAHAKGENRAILPADTMKNTVYVLARQYAVETIEEFCLHVADHFLTYNPQVTRLLVGASETLWTRVPLGAKPHASTFIRAGEERRTATLDGTRGQTTIRSGIENLVVLKTTNFAFEDFRRDPYTTLKDTRDMILSGVIRANWLYESEEIEFGPIWHGVRKILLENFAEHDSRSLQNTLFAMGEAVLSTFDNIKEIELSLMDKDCRLADLAPFGMDNPAAVFLPSDERHGLIEAKVRKSSGA